MQDKSKVYRSETLFPLFANRLLDESRPEYPEYLGWLGVDQAADKMEVLARSGGQRGTDRLCVYPEVDPNERGEMILYFFSHGLRHLNGPEQDAVRQLKPGVRLQMKRDDNNAYDCYALQLTTGEMVRVGFCPRYLNQDLRSIQDQTSIQLTVEKSNLDAPLYFQLLCKAVFTLPREFKIFKTEAHQSLAQEALVA